MDIKINGHSGCTIEVVNRGNQLRLIKSTSDVKYIDRLVEQANKQQRYSGHEYAAIKVPHILKVNKGNVDCSVEMEYIYSKNFVDFLETGNVNQIDAFLFSICHFIDSMIADSAVQKIPAEILLQKWEDVCGKIRKNSWCKDDPEIQELLKRSDHIFQTCPDLEIPVGYCHGDLTLSNILFNGYVYYLIDFLDSFIESPLMDIVKLRQDTAFHWSVLMFEGDYAKSRMNLIMDRLDEKIQEHYAQFVWYKKYYGVFQLMNFLRILQYAHEERIVEYLKKTLKYILDHEF